MAASGCAELEPQLVAYLKGELDTADAERVDRHLEGCEQCREALESYRKTLQLLDEIPIVEPSAETRTRIEVKVERSIRTMRRSRRLFRRMSGERSRFVRSLGIAAAACAMFLAGSVFWVLVPGRGGITSVGLDSRAIARKALLASLPCHHVVLSRNTVSVGEVLPDGVVIITGCRYSEEAAGERCIFAYSEAAFEELPEQTLNEGVRTEVTGGNLTLPQNFVRDYLDDSEEVTVVSVQPGKRAEIWSRSRLKHFLSTPGHIKLSPGSV